MPQLQRVLRVFGRAFANVYIVGSPSQPLAAIIHKIFLQRSARAICVARYIAVAEIPARGRHRCRDTVRVARNPVPRIPATGAKARVAGDVDVVAIVGIDGAEGDAAGRTAFGGADLAELVRADADFATVADGGAEGSKEEDKAGEEGD